MVKRLTAQEVDLFYKELAVWVDILKRADPKLEDMGQLMPLVPWILSKESGHGGNVEKSSKGYFGIAQVRVDEYQTSVNEATELLGELSALTYTDAQAVRLLQDYGVDTSSMSAGNGSNPLHSRSLEDVRGQALHFAMELRSMILGNATGRRKHVTDSSLTELTGKTVAELSINDLYPVWLMGPSGGRGFLKAYYDKNTPRTTLLKDVMFASGRPVFEDPGGGSARYDRNGGAHDPVTGRRIPYSEVTIEDWYRELQSRDSKHRGNIPSRYEALAQAGLRGDAAERTQTPTTDREKAAQALRDLAFADPDGFNKLYDALRQRAEAYNAVAAEEAKITVPEEVVYDHGAPDQERTEQLETMVKSFMTANDALVEKGVLRDPSDGQQDTPPQERQNQGNPEAERRRQDHLRDQSVANSSGVPDMLMDFLLLSLFVDPSGRTAQQMLQRYFSGQSDPVIGPQRSRGNLRGTPETQYRRVEDGTGTHVRNPDGTFREVRPGEKGDYSPVQTQQYNPDKTYEQLPLVIPHTEEDLAQKKEDGVVSDDFDAQKNIGGPIIVIDPGHFENQHLGHNGQIDPSKRGGEIAAVPEAARIYKMMLESQGFHVIMTKTSDGKPTQIDGVTPGGSELGKRRNLLRLIEQKYPGQLAGFISLHFDYEKAPERTMYVMRHPEEGNASYELTRALIDAGGDLYGHPGQVRVGTDDGSERVTGVDGVTVLDPIYNHIPQILIEIAPTTAFDTYYIDGDSRARTGTGAWDRNKWEFLRNLTSGTVSYLKVHRPDLFAQLGPAVKALEAEQQRVERERQQELQRDRDALGLDDRMALAAELSGQLQRQGVMTLDTAQPYSAVLDANGNLVSGNNSFSRADPASTTKHAVLLGLLEMQRAGKLPEGFWEQDEVLADIKLIASKSDNVAPQRLVARALGLSIEADNTVSKEHGDKIAQWISTYMNKGFVTRLGLVDSHFSEGYMVSATGNRWSGYGGLVGMNDGLNPDGSPGRDVVNGKPGGTWTTAYDMARIEQELLTLAKDNPNLMKYLMADQSGTLGKFKGAFDERSLWVTKTGTAGGDYGRLREGDLGARALVAANIETGRTIAMLETPPDKHLSTAQALLRKAKGADVGIDIQAALTRLQAERAKAREAQQGPRINPERHIYYADGGPDLTLGGKDVASPDTEPARISLREMIQRHQSGVQDRLNALLPELGLTGEHGEAILDVKLNSAEYMMLLTGRLDLMSAELRQALTGKKDGGIDDLPSEFVAAMREGQVKDSGPLVSFNMSGFNDAYCAGTVSSALLFSHPAIAYAWQRPDIRAKLSSYHQSEIDKYGMPVDVQAYASIFRELGVLEPGQDGKPLTRDALTGLFSKDTPPLVGSVISFADDKTAIYSPTETSPEGPSGNHMGMVLDTGSDAQGDYIIFGQGNYSVPEVDGGGEGFTQFKIYYTDAAGNSVRMKLPDGRPLAWYAPANRLQAYSLMYKEKVAEYVQTHETPPVETTVEAPPVEITQDDGQPSWAVIKNGTVIGGNNPTKEMSSPEVDANLRKALTVYLLATLSEPAGDGKEAPLPESFFEQNDALIKEVFETTNLQKIQELGRLIMRAPGLANGPLKDETVDSRLREALSGIIQQAELSGTALATLRQGEAQADEPQSKTTAADLARLMGLIQGSTQARAIFERYGREVDGRMQTGGAGNSVFWTNPTGAAVVLGAADETALARVLEQSVRAMEGAVKPQSGETIGPYKNVEKYFDVKGILSTDPIRLPTMDVNAEWFVFGSSTARGLSEHNRGVQMRGNMAVGSAGVLNETTRSATLLLTPEDWHEVQRSSNPIPKGSNVLVHVGANDVGLVKNDTMFESMFERIIELVETVKEGGSNPVLVGLHSDPKHHWSAEGRGTTARLNARLEEYAREHGLVFVDIAGKVEPGIPHYGWLAPDGYHLSKKGAQGVFNEAKAAMGRLMTERGAREAEEVEVEVEVRDDTPPAASAIELLTHRPPLEPERGMQPFIPFYGADGARDIDAKITYAHREWNELTAAQQREMPWIKGGMMGADNGENGKAEPSGLRYERGVLYQGGNEVAYRPGQDLPIPSTPQRGLPVVPVSLYKYADENGLISIDTVESYGINGNGSAWTIGVRFEYNILTGEYLNVQTYGSGGNRRDAVDEARDRGAPYPTGVAISTWNDGSDADQINGVGYMGAYSMDYKGGKTGLAFGAAIDLIDPVWTRGDTLEHFGRRVGGKGQFSDGCRAMYNSKAYIEGLRRLGVIKEGEQPTGRRIFTLHPENVERLGYGVRTLPIEKMPEILRFMRTYDDGRPMTPQQLKELRAEDRRRSASLILPPDVIPEDVKARIAAVADIDPAPPLGDVDSIRDRGFRLAYQSIGTGDAENPLGVANNFLEVAMLEQRHMQDILEQQRAVERERLAREAARRVAEQAREATHTGEIEGGTAVQPTSVAVADNTGANKESGRVG